MKKHFIYLISAIIAVSFVFVSCSEDENGNNYNGNGYYNGDENGDICPPDCQDECCYVPQGPTTISKTFNRANFVDATATVATIGTWTSMLANYDTLKISQIGGAEQWLDSTKVANMAGGMRGMSVDKLSRVRPLGELHTGGTNTNVNDIDFLTHIGFVRLNNPCAPLKDEVVQMGKDSVTGRADFLRDFNTILTQPYNIKDLFWYVFNNHMIGGGFIQDVTFRDTVGNIIPSAGIFVGTHPDNPQVQSFIPAFMEFMPRVDDIALILQNLSVRRGEFDKCLQNNASAGADL